MSIQFSGLGSGLPIDDWIKALVKVKQEKIDVLSNQQKALQTKSSTLGSLSTLFNNVKTAATKLTDSAMGPSSDIFSGIVVKSSEDSKEKKAITATATNLSTPSEFDIEVQELATKSKLQSGHNDALRSPKTKLSELGVTGESTLNINGAEIKVTGDTTVDELVYKIGNNPDAGVNAYLKSGKLVIESKQTGASEITVGGTAADALGFNASDAVKEAGKDAQFTINGEAMTSKTNTIGSEVTGITGLSMTLNSTTTSPVNIKLTRDYSKDSVKAALNEFVSAFNKAISETDKATATDGTLYGENQLNEYRNNLRSMVSDPVGDGKYKTLADIGITTGKPGLDVSASTNQLVLDEEKFAKAFAEDPESVKKLLVGDTSNGTKGVMQSFQTAIEPAVDSTKGYFKTRNESLSKEIGDMANKISRKNDELVTYQANLQKQYNYMDMQIAKMNQQFDYMKQQLSSLFGSTSK